MGVESLLLHNVSIVSVVLKVLGNSTSRRSGWSQCLVQIIGVAVWSGRNWKRLKMWTHRVQRLDDRCHILFSP